MLLTLALLYLLAPSADARPLSATEKLSDLDQLVAILKSGYGPLQYKEEVQGIDLDSLRAAAAAEVESSKSNAEFYYLLVRFAARLRDSHFSVSVPSELKADLGFATDFVQDRVVIDSIDRNRLPESLFPFRRGDEILKLNGSPVARELDRLQSYIGAGSPASARRKAAIHLTSRSGATFPIPSGGVQLEIHSHADSATRTVALAWQIQGEPVDEKIKEFRENSQELLRDSDTDFDRLSIAEFWKDAPHAEGSYRCSGRSRIEIPAGATVLRLEPFVAYYFPSPKGNLGYLRIGEYQPLNKEGIPEYKTRFQQYQGTVDILERETRGLIIDQDHNCGGSVDYMHSIVSLFLDRSIQPLQFQLLASKEQVLLYRNWMRTLPLDQPRRANVQKVFELLWDTWENGGFLTAATAIDGTPEIAPNPIRYTHPLIVLADELAGSGGDAFPALLQGNGRALILGGRTMGAGGHVREFPPLYFSQIGVRLTKSLFLSPAGIPIENNGVTPDIPYAPTLDDFIHGYRDYREFFTARLLELLR